MGILNVTPDSYYDGGKYFNVEDAISRGIAIFNEGADIIDIGGESTRPGATPITVEEELNRVIPVIKVLKTMVKIPLSIDTFKPRVAALALEAGASFINDITGFENPEMQEIAASWGVDVCIMHMQGTPQTMQLQIEYPENIIDYLLNWFEKRTSILLQKGIKQERIFLDPGIGFGKTVEHNIEIIENLPRFRSLGFPLLLGISRKSFMRKILNKPVEQMLPPTIALNGFLIMNGVEIIRVHDVSAHRSVIDLLARFKMSY